MWAARVITPDANTHGKTGNFAGKWSEAARRGASARRTHTRLNRPDSPQRRPWLYFPNNTKGVSPMKMLKLSSPVMSTGIFCVIPPKAAGGVIETEVDSLEAGVIITIEVIEMSEEEYEALPEFEG